MPCYLFTYHGYGTWMPDHPRGYVKRNVGVLPPDARMASCYRQHQKEKTVELNTAVQQTIVDEAVRAFGFQSLRGHFIATDRTHVHILVSWNLTKTWKAVRQSIRTSLTRQLNQVFEHRTWFAKQPSRKRVRDQQHFEYLVNVYLPRHRGLKWREGVGVVGQFSGEAVASRLMCARKLTYKRNFGQ